MREISSFLSRLFNPEFMTKSGISYGKSFKYFSDMNLVMRKPDFCICENKDADQLRGNREADQRLCFRYIDGATPLLSISEISSL